MSRNTQSRLSVPSVSRALLNDGPVEEEKYDGYEGHHATSDAEQWLTRKSSKTSESKKEDNKENENFGGDSKRKEGSVESDAEQWLTRGNRELLQQWKRNEDALEDRGQLSHAIESRSSVSSPGKTSLREKLQHRLLKRQELRKKRWQEEQQKLRLEIRVDQDESTENREAMNDILGTLTDETRPTSPTSDTGLSTPVDPRDQHSRHRNTDLDEASNVSLYRLSRTVRYGRRGELPHSPEQANVIRLHIYDVLASDTIMQFPFGYEFPIGKCFQTMNNGLHALGTGAYHCGIEVNGIEYAYGANNVATTTGVFTCVPKHSPGYEIRASIDFGSRVFRKKSWINVQTDLVNTKTGEGQKISDVYQEVENFVDGREVMKVMAAEYKGTDYDLLQKNCCHFARDACLRLGLKEEEIPTWFMNLASAGAVTRNAAQKAVAAFSSLNGSTIQPEHEQLHAAETGGFEMVLEEANSKEYEIVKVVDTLEESDPRKSSRHGVRRTLSWTY